MMFSFFNVIFTFSWIQLFWQRENLQRHRRNWTGSWHICWGCLLSKTASHGCWQVSGIWAHLYRFCAVNHPVCNPPFPLAPPSFTLYEDYYVKLSSSITVTVNFHLFGMINYVNFRRDGKAKNLFATVSSGLYATVFLKLLVLKLLGIFKLIGFGYEQSNPCTVKTTQNSCKSIQFILLS